MEYLRLATERLQEPLRFERKEATVGALSHRTVEQQDARLVRQRGRRFQPGDIGHSEGGGRDVG
jgi:hypothetical protein